MRGINRVTLLGYVGTNPELLVSKGGREYARLNVATKRSWKNGEGKWEEQTDWHRIQVWGMKAKLCCDRLKKGGMVLVEGHISTYKQEDDAKGVSRTSVVAEDVHFLPEPRALIERELREMA
jgi:single-strand DNA-binding protein